MFSMNFAVEKLVKILKENREKHAKFVEEMAADHKVALKNVLEKKLQDLEAGKQVNHDIDLEQPMNYLENYDQVIQMLELTEDKSMALSNHQFQQYVMDEWPQKKQLLSVSSTYKQLI